MDKLKEKFSQLGEYKRLIERGKSFDFDFKYNSHIHLPPNFSTFNTIEEVVKKAKEEGIKVIGCSNYYDYSIYDVFVEKCFCNGIVPLVGTEVIVFVDELARKNIRVNDPNNPGRMYLCGKALVGFDSLSEKANGILEQIRRNDVMRIKKMIDKLNEVFKKYKIDIRLDEREIKEKVADRCGCGVGVVYLQERHLARVCQEEIFGRFGVDERKEVLGRFGNVNFDCNDEAKVQNFIRSVLLKVGKPAYVEEKFIDFELAVEFINELGGVVCYPVLADGAEPICEFEYPVDRLIENLKKRRIEWVEFIPLRNDVKKLVEYVSRLDESGFIILAGTEHNTPSKDSLEPRCKGGVLIPEEINIVFRKGVCYSLGVQYVRVCGLKADGFSKDDLISLGGGIVKSMMD